MQDFHASLVREKIIIHDPTRLAGAEGEATGPLIIRSNRLMLQLEDPFSSETVVIRAQNMHTTLRLAAKIFYSYSKNGLFAARREPYDWPGMWDMLLSAYDRKYNPGLWAAVYIGGKPVFRTAEMPFVDVIEQCALRDIDNYDAAITTTGNALKKAGQTMEIDQQSKVGSVFTDDGKALRCGVIHRADGRDTTFNFVATGGEGHGRVVQGFNIAAAFLEAIDIRHHMRATFKRVQSGALSKSSPEMAKFYACPQRLRDLRKSLQSFEEHFDVKYRPEKPDVFSPPKEVVVV